MRLIERARVLIAVTSPTSQGKCLMRCRIQHHIDGDADVSDEDTRQKTHRRYDRHEFTNSSDYIDVSIYPATGCSVSSGSESAVFAAAESVSHLTIRSVLFQNPEYVSHFHFHSSLSGFVVRLFGVPAWYREARGVSPSLSERSSSSSSFPSREGTTLGGNSLDSSGKPVFSYITSFSMRQGTINKLYGMRSSRV